MKTLLYTLLAAALAFPVSTYAQAPVSLPDPLGQPDIRLLAARFIQGGLSIMGTIALLMMIYGGFLWLTSAGNSSKVQEGRDVLIWSVLGILVIASAFVVTTAVFNAILTGDVAATN